MLKMLTWVSPISLYRSVLLGTFLWELYMSVHVYQYKGSFADVWVLIVYFKSVFMMPFIMCKQLGLLLEWSSFVTLFSDEVVEWFSYGWT